jgi:hypothetical protein
MKNVIFAAAFMSILSTPALAHKTRIDPPQTCDNSILEWQMIYHLDQVEMLIDEMRQNVLNVPSKPKNTIKKLE